MPVEDLVPAPGAEGVRGARSEASEEAVWRLASHAKPGDGTPAPRLIMTFMDFLKILLQYWRR